MSTGREYARSCTGNQSRGVAGLQSLACGQVSGVVGTDEVAGPRMPLGQVAGPAGRQVDVAAEPGDGDVLADVRAAEVGPVLAFLVDFQSHTAMQTPGELPVDICLRPGPGARRRGIFRSSAASGINHADKRAQNGAEIRRIR